MPAPGMHSGRPDDASMDLRMSQRAVPLHEAVCRFVEQEINPVTEEYYRRGAETPC